jgi:hypothetical protein
VVPTNLLNAIRRPAYSSNAGAGGEYTPDQLAAMLARLDVTDFQDEAAWRVLMFACHHATGGDGEAEFVTWSAGDPNFAGDSASVVKRWRSCRDKANAITAGTLRHILREHDIRDATDARTSGARTHVQPINVRDVKASPHINVRDAGTKRRKAMP